MRVWRRVVTFAVGAVLCAAGACSDGEEGTGGQGTGGTTGTGGTMTAAPSGLSPSGNSGGLDEPCAVTCNTGDTQDGAVCQNCIDVACIGEGNACVVDNTGVSLTNARHVDAILAH